MVTGVVWDVVKRVKINMLRWFGHVAEFVKNVYVSESVGPNSRGRPLGRWRDRVKEYMCERNANKGRLDQARRECLYKERWMPFCYDYTHGLCKMAWTC